MKQVELLFWAKTDQTGKDKEWTRPLWSHLLDVACVAEVLWDVILSETLKKQIVQILGCTLNEARSFITWLCGVHDVGKAIPPFQIQHEFSKALLANAGLSFPKKASKVRHEHATYKLLTRWYQERYSRTGWFDDIAFLLAFHHSHSTTKSDAEKDTASDVIGENDWKAAQNALIDCTVEVLKPFIPVQIAQKNYWQSWTYLFMGLVSYADWIASMEGNFPHQLTQKPHEYLPTARAAAQQAIKHIGADLTAQIQGRKFGQLFGETDADGKWKGFTPRAVQKAVVRYTERQRLSETQSTPLLAIIEAPTADGKTEAALHLAAQLQAISPKKKARRGIYLAMPTQATSNGLLKRFLAFLERAHDASAHPANTLLIHGQSNLHETQEMLKENMNKFIYASQIESISGGERDDRKFNQTATVGTAAWFLPKKRSLLAPFGIGTIDQALLAVLQTKFFFLRLFGLHDKTIIFDEVHAYDAYMLTLLERLIAWLKASGSDVILLSATLPDTMRKRFIQAWTGDKTDTSPNLPVQYSALTFVRGGKLETEPVYKDELPLPNMKEERPSKKTVHLEPIIVSPNASEQIERIAADAVAAYNNGAAVAVLCNSVDRAQRVFQKICEKLNLKEEEAEKTNLHLIHSRMTYGQRSQKESLILNSFGVGFQGDRKGIVVGTQILEQSLDVDFDAMITDIAPIDLLLQRAGRLHRHLWRTFRPAAHSSPTLQIVIPESSTKQTEAPSFRTVAAVYSDFIMQQTWRVLHQENDPSKNWRMEWHIPDDVRSLVNAVYDEETQAEFEKESRLEKAFFKQSGETISKQQSAFSVLIFDPREADYITDEGLRLLDDEAIENQMRAATRLEINSVRLICFHEDEHEQWYLDADCTIPFEQSLTESSEGVRTLLHNTVSVSAEKVVSAVLSFQKNEPGIFAQWQATIKNSSGLLGLIPMIFKHCQWKHHKENVTVSFNQTLGLVINEKAS